MPRSVPVKIRLYLPQTPEGQKELTRRVAGVHADLASAAVRNLSCTSEQKLALVDSIIAAKRSAAG